jgi:hypothetical protein
MGSRNDTTMKSTKPQCGYFFLADISGFSSYLTKVDLEHAGGILQKLLEGIARKIEPVFHAQDFDVDSVFAFVPESGIRHFDHVYKLIEDAYVEFKENHTEISNHITCNCAACRDVTALDLKFMIHYGEYILSSVQDKFILYGQDPTFVRNRGWKETISASVGWRGHVLFTESRLASLHAPADKFQGEKFFQDQISIFGSELKSNDT